jgi:endo-1,4-beta-D-glucanase Y
VNRFRRLLAIGGVLLILISIGITATVRYYQSSQRTVPIVYTDNAELLELYNAYKVNNIEAGSNRTLDKTQGNITTSEAESYTMLRAVWMDDQTTFKNSLTFSIDNLQRSDHLFSWKFGELPDGKYGVLTNEGGQNTASDGDVEIALSLLMAYSRWNDSTYLTQAQQIIANIWNEEVVQVDGQPILTADDLERNNPTSVVVDPSYLDPAAFKLFAKVDPSQNWTGLVNNSYTLLGNLSNATLGSTSSDGLPPDWITLNRTTGAFMPNAASNLDTNYGYDAFRVPFRLALDYNWFHDPRDIQVLNGFSFLKTTWEKNKMLDSVYSHSGSVVSNYEDPAMYGASIGYFDVIDKQDAKQVYDEKLQTLYSPDKQSWKTSPNYYSDNWAWFGIALTQNALPDLAQETN